MVGSKDNQDPYDDEHREEDHDGDDHDDGDHDLTTTTTQDTDRTVDERTSLREWTQFVRGSYPRTMGSSSSASSARGSGSRSGSRSRSRSAKKEKKKNDDDPSRVPKRPGLTKELKETYDRLGSGAGRGSSNSNTTSDPDSDSEMEMAMDIETWQKAHPDTVRRIRRFYCVNGWVPVPMMGTRCEGFGSGRGGEEDEGEDSGDEEGEEDEEDDKGDDDERVHDGDDDETSSTHSTTDSTRSDTSDTEMIEQIVLEYALKGPEQRKNIQASVDLAVDFFPGSLGVFRLGVGGSAASGSGGTGEDDDDDQPVGEVVSGPDEMVRIWNEVKVDLDGGVGGLGGCRFRRSREGQGKREARHCDHEARQGDTSDDAEAVHLEPGPRRETFIPGLRSDWRFSQHPFVQRAKVDSYISRSIELELDREALPSHDLPSIPASEKIVRLVVGTLDVYCTHTMDTTLSPTQERVLSRITLMLQTQLKATWEGRRRSREARANTAISGFIDDALASHDPTRLVASVQKSKDENRKRQGENYVDLDRLEKEKEATTNGSDPAEPLQEEPGKLEEMARSACGRLSAVLGDIDGLCIVDLRSVQPVDRYNPEEYYVDTESPYPTNSLAHFRSSEDVVFPDFRQIEAAQAIAKFLESSSGLPRFSFRQGVAVSGLEDFLPKSTVTHVAMPFFVPDDPLFIIIATSRDPHYYFDQRDTNIIRTMGSVLRAQALQARMVAADAIKTAFLSSISHELRTPMHGVLTGLQLVRDAWQRHDWDQLGLILGVAESSGKTLQHLLNDVLDFGSIGKKGQKRSRLAEVDLAKSADEMAMACSTRMSSDKKDSVDVELIVEHEERDWKAMIDEAGFHRILINGLTNAIKFTKTGSITLKLSTNEDRTKVIIQIVDTGIGIKAKFAPRLFEPFTKSDSFSPGAGLGLYITKGLVDRMNGTLVLHPNAKGGTTFEVVLPVQMINPGEGSGKIVSKPIKGFLTVLETDDGEGEDGAVTPEGKGQTEAAGQTQYDLSPKTSTDSPTPGQQQTKPAVAPTSRKPTDDLTEAVRVLVVDDNEISRKLLLMALKRSPTKVTTAQATDGREAVQKFKDFKPDLVLTDVSMPVMDGLTAAGKMRQVECGRDGEVEWKKDRSRSGSEEGQGDSPVDQDAGNRYKARIFAITGLGSSDSRLKSDALRGGASLDGWLVKGEHGLEVIYKIVKETLEKRTERRSSV